jgi:hypothetical protein
MQIRSRLCNYVSAANSVEIKAIIKQKNTTTKLSIYFLFALALQKKNGVAA